MVRLINLSQVWHTLKFRYDYVYLVAKRVEIGDWGSIWDAITSTDPFEVCWSEDYYDGACIGTAPGWGSWGALGIVAVECFFWLFILILGWQKIRRHQKQEQKRVQLSQDRQ